MKECIEEFYKVSIRAGQIQDTYKKVARYINGLRMEIQYEISVMFPKTVEETYQMVLKAEEKLMRKQSTRSRGTFRGRGSQGGREIFTTPRDGANSSSNQHTPIEGNVSGKRSF